MISIKLNDQNRVFFYKTYIPGDEETYIVSEYTGNPMMMLYSNNELVSDDTHKRYVILEEKRNQGLTKDNIMITAMSSLPYDVNGVALYTEDEKYTTWMTELSNYLAMFDDAEITQEVINNTPKYPLA